MSGSTPKCTAGSAARSKPPLAFGWGMLKIRENGKGKDAPGRPNTVKELDTGVVDNLDYKIIEAGRADDLFAWLKENKYSYAGDESTLNFYIKKHWLFTVMKIDTMQMKKNKQGWDLLGRGHADPL